MYVILVYDIKNDQGGAKVLSKTFKTCKKYLMHIQNSVFEGEISEAQLLKLKMELNKVIREDRDSLIVFKCRNEKWIPKEFWGVADDKTRGYSRSIVECKGGNFIRIAITSFRYSRSIVECKEQYRASQLEVTPDIVEA